ncbi:MAG: Holliday junction branch migration protein RuvA [Bacilli bacterium]
MIFYLKGKICYKDKETIAIDVNDVAYELLVSHLEDYNLGDEKLIYTYNVVREDENYLVGFSSLEEKQVFLSLIKVKGIGPKSAITALSSTTPDLFKKAISSNNVAYLKKLPGIGQKAASQIILDLKGSLTGTKGHPEIYDEAFEALKNLGFKGAQIDRALASINEPDLTLEQLIKKSLQILRK